MLSVVDNETDSEVLGERSTLDEIAREGVRRMLTSALEDEVQAYIEADRGERDTEGHAQVLRNGKARARQVTVGSGTVDVRAPLVSDRRGERRFTSAIVAPYMRRSPKVAEVLPILYLRGPSSGDFRPALTSLLGEAATGLSPTAITRLTAQWEAEYRDLRERDLGERDYVYVWVYGIHFNIRLEDERLCTLAIVGVRSDGTQELVGLDDGYRKSTGSWAELLRDLRRNRRQLV